MSRDGIGNVKATSNREKWNRHNQQRDDEFDRRHGLSSRVGRACRIAFAQANGKALTPARPLRGRWSGDESTVIEACSCREKGNVALLLSTVLMLFGVARLRKRLSSRGVEGFAE